MRDVLERLKAALADRYTVEREVGSGGMAVVYLAQDNRLERRVAIKVLRPELASVVAAERFLREIRVTASLSHPHILPLLESGKADGLLYYIMPYVEGESLREKLDRETRLSVEEAVRIAREVADALSYAHGRNLLHRDVKPENILLQAGHAVVADFGIARALSEAGGDRLTETGVSIGTPAYMSPEQGAGERDLSEASDLYSLACVLYEMLTGEPPILDSSMQNLVSRKLLGEFRPLKQARPEVSPEIDIATKRALATEPAERFRSAREFADALTSTIRVDQGAQSKRRWPLWAAATTVAVVAGLAWYVGWGRVAPAGRLPDGRLGLAVFPFRPSGGAVEDLSEGVADLLATVLDGTQQMRIADPWSLWRSLRPERSSRAQSPDPKEASRLAQKAGAGHFLLGSVFSTGDSLRLNVRVYEVGNLEPLYAFARTGDRAGLSNVVQRLAVEVISRLWSRGKAPNVPDLDLYATHSADALKAFLDAKAAMRRGMVDSASAAIDRALALDSTFALALVEATRIKSWQQSMKGEFFTGLLELAQRAVAHGDSLSERNRLRAEATLASIRTDGATARRAVQRIIEIDSTDFDAWDGRAYYDMVYGWQYGAHESDMVEAAERVVQLDSTFVPGLFRRASLAVYVEDPEDMRLQMRRLRAADTTNVLISGALSGLKAILASDSAFGSIADQIAAATPREWITPLTYLRFAQPARAEILLKRLRETAGPEGPQFAAQGETARLHLAEGRLVQVDEAVRAGDYRIWELYKHLYRFQVAAALSGVGEPAVAERAVGWLAKYVPRDSALAYFEVRPVWWTGWLVGAYNATFGDTLVARRWEETISTFPEGGTPLDYRGALRADLEARLEVRRGDLKGALGDARTAFRLSSIHSENDWEALPAPQIRFHLAMLYRANDLPDSAAALLRSLVPPTTWMGFLTARASYELGELSENRGDLTDAVRHYRHAYRYWQHGGSEIAFWRERAAAGLRRTVGEERAR